MTKGTGVNLPTFGAISTWVHMLGVAAGIVCV